MTAPTSTAREETVMELFTFVLVAVAAAVVIAFAAHYLAQVVRDDGYRV